MINFEEGEYIIYLARKHWFILAVRIFSMVIAALLPLLILPVLGFIPQLPHESAFSFFTFFYLVFLLFVWIMSFLLWTDYYLDICIITNKRLIEIEQKGLFNREVSTMRYEMIQDVTTEIEGVIPTLMNYGDLHVQTAATTREFFLTQINNPGMVKAIISEEIGKQGGGNVLSRS